ncbi:MAG: hypothetical protein VX908_03065, partial [Planctomycetota bacterium]|nr:hypothetical protein [Planctomycetota bacterium]
MRRRVASTPPGSCSQRGMLPDVSRPVFRDLASFMRHLEGAGELLRVPGPVSPILEITEVADRHSKSRCSLQSNDAAVFDP